MGKPEKRNLVFQRHALAKHNTVTGVQNHQKMQETRVLRGARFTACPMADKQIVVYTSELERCSKHDKFVSHKVAHSNILDEFTGNFDVA